MKDLIRLIAFILLAFGVPIALGCCGFCCWENRIASYYDMSVQSYCFGEYVDGDGNIYRYDDTHKVMVKQGIQNEEDK